jgi:quercetin dioxygenase-like cupin family protein
MVAQVVLSAPRLDETVRFFTDRLGFRIDTVFPADDPRVVVVSGRGLSLRLERDGASGSAVLRLGTRPAEPEAELVAPNGTRVHVVRADSVPELAPLRATFVHTPRDESAWKQGRAGMLYRDLVPGRLGGHFIASHIRILDGGPVPDYVHYHEIEFQLIYCTQGWVRVMYEDQGPSFVMSVGDAVLQPPRIRHRVLECAAGTEVVEIACPAEHVTRVDHELVLPSEGRATTREFSGQRFVFHVAAQAAAQPFRDLGMDAATAGRISARVWRRSASEAAEPRTHEHAFVFWFVLGGAGTLSAETDEALASGDAVVIPSGFLHTLVPSAEGLEILEVVVR